MKTIRILFLISVLLASFLMFNHRADNPYMVFIIFASLGGGFFLLEYLTSKFDIVYLISFITAFLFAVLLSLLVVYMVSFFKFDLSAKVVLLFSFLIFFYLCFAAVFRLTEAKYIASPKGMSGLIVVDTSSIIDGRIADLCATRFVSARLVIPKVVLKELQQIADSHDPLKRVRGRRGLDILNKMRKTKIEIVIDEHDFPEIREVDTKLIQLAKFYNAAILTTDYNLNKVAELQGVVVLNINDLANALKPVVLPGENMKIKVVKEGKEQKQGIGYLDDGTMVVVEEAKHLMGNVLDVVVTSVLQTSAGRIIFTKKSKR